MTSLDRVDPESDLPEEPVLAVDRSADGAVRHQRSRRSRVASQFVRRCCNIPRRGTRRDLRRTPRSRARQVRGVAAHLRLRLPARGTRANRITSPVALRGIGSPPVDSSIA